MIEVRTGLDSGDSQSRLSVGLQLSQRKEVVKTDAMQLGNAMRSLYRAHWSLEWETGGKKGFRESGLFFLRQIHYSKQQKALG